DRRRDDADTIAETQARDVAKCTALAAHQREGAQSTDPLVMVQPRYTAKVVPLIGEMWDSVQQREGSHMITKQDPYSRTSRNPGVVVGIDGSPHSHAALRAAATEAALHGTDLTLLCTYSLSPWSDTAKEAGHGLADESYLRQLCQG